MKASKEFVNTLVKGIELLKHKYGAENVTHRMAIYRAVLHSVTPGFEHNIMVEMEPDEFFYEEAKNLETSNIITAVSAAMKRTKLA